MTFYNSRLEKLFLGIQNSKHSTIRLVSKDIKLYLFSQ